MMTKDYKFFIILTVLMLLNIIDAAATAYWIDNQLATEANPLMESWLDMSPFFFIFMKVALVLACGTLLWKLRDRKLTYVLLVPVFIVYVYVFIKHIVIAYSAFF